MADGRHLKKIEKLLYLSRGSTNFDQIWHGEVFRTFDRPDREKLKISKIQDGGGRHFEKFENSHTSAAFGPILKKFGKMMQFDPLDRPDC